MQLQDERILLGLALKEHHNPTPDWKTTRYEH
jgi:hypothetical protein